MIILLEIVYFNVEESCKYWIPTHLLSLYIIQKMKLNNVTFSVLGLIIKGVFFGRKYIAFCMYWNLKMKTVV